MKDLRRFIKFFFLSQAVSVRKMLSRNFILIFYFFASVHPIFACGTDNVADTTSDSVPFITRAYWMRAANQVLFDSDSPCPFRAFGTVIVNHTVPGLGELVCAGINLVSNTGNPTEHGEIVAINNCTEIFTANNGLTPDEVSKAFSQLSLYTNGEACPIVSIFFGFVFNKHPNCA